MLEDFEVTGMNEINRLYKLQDKILMFLSDFVATGNRFPFFLTGGTALLDFILRTLIEFRTT